MTSKDTRIHSQSERDVNIYPLAIACHNTLKDFEPRTLGDYDENFLRLVNALDHRLNAWGNYLGVFAVESASLDRRVENDPMVKELITQNLSQLLKNLQLLTKTSPYTGDDGLSMDAESPASSEKIVRLIYDAAEQSIDRLERLGRAIRRSSTTGLQRRVELFAKQDVTISTKEILKLVVKNKYPLAADSLVTFLGRMMVLTYARLEYKRKHQVKLQTHRPTNPELNPLVEAPDHILGSVEARQLGAQRRTVCEIESGEARAALSDVVPNPQVPVSEVSSTTPSTFHALPRGSLSSAGSSVMLSGINYPKPPKTDLGVLKTCVWCFEHYKAEQFEDTRWWRRHVNRDLIPYVCLAENCAKSPPQFDSFNEWKHHMNSHSPRWAEKVHALAWFCDEDHNERQIFRNLRDLEKHMREEHSNRFSDFQISSIAKRNTIQHSRLPGDCPICCRNIQRNESIIPKDLQDTQITSENQKIKPPAIEQSIRRRKRKGKQVRFDVSQSGTLSGPDSDTECERNVDIATARRKLSDEELRNQMAKHVAEHLSRLAVFVLRYLPSNEELDESSSQEDSTRDTIYGDVGDASENSTYIVSENSDAWDLESTSFMPPGEEIRYEGGRRAKMQPEELLDTDEFEGSTKSVSAAYPPNMNAQGQVPYAQNDMPFTFGNPQQTGYMPHQAVIVRKDTNRHYDDGNRDEFLDQEESVTHTKTVFTDYEEGWNDPIWSQDTSKDIPGSVVLGSNTASEKLDASLYPSRPYQAPHTYHPDEDVDEYGDVASVLSDDNYPASDTQNKGKGIANYSSSPIGNTYGVTPVKYEPRSNSELINEEVEKLVSSDTEILSSVASRRDLRGRTDMMRLAVMGDLEGIQEWLTVTDSTYISVKDIDGKTVLHHLIIGAATKPNMSKDLPEILSKILDLAPQLVDGLDAMGRSPLYFSGHNFQLFEILIKAGARIDKLTFNTVIEEALEIGTYGLVKFCLDHDADVQWVDDRLKARMRSSKHLKGLIPSRAPKERRSMLSFGRRDKQ